MKKQLLILIVVSSVIGTANSIEYEYDRAWLLAKGAVKTGFGALSCFLTYKNFQNREINLDFRSPFTFINPKTYLSLAFGGTPEQPGLSALLLFGALGFSYSGVNDIYHGIEYKTYIKNQECKFKEIEDQLNAWDYEGYDY